MYSHTLPLSVFPLSRVGGGGGKQKGQTKAKEKAVGTRLVKYNFILLNKQF